MALDYTNLYPDTSNNGAFTKSWNYTALSSADTMATISAAGFFNKVATRLGIGDNINVAIVDAFDKSRTALVDYNVLYVTAIAGGVVTTAVRPVSSIGGVIGAITLDDGLALTGLSLGLTHSIPVYDTATALSASVTVASTQTMLRTRGKLAVGDYGGATYLQVASDLGYPGTLALANGRFAQILEYTVTPQMFKLSTDAGDDGLMLTRFFDFVNEQLPANTPFGSGAGDGYGGKGVIPGGITYNIATGVAVKANANKRTTVSAYGAVFTTSGVIYAFTVTGGGSSGGITLEGFSFKQQNSVAAGAIAVLGAGNTRVVSPIIWAGQPTNTYYNGIYIGLNGATGSYWTLIENPQIFSSTADTIPFGIFTEDECNEIRIIGGMISDCVHGVGLYPGASNNNGNNNRIRDVSFEDCTTAVYYSGVLGVATTAIEGLKVTGNRFENCGNSIIFHNVDQNGSNPPEISGNWYIGPAMAVLSNPNNVRVRNTDLPADLAGSASFSAASTKAITFAFAQPTANYVVNAEMPSNQPVWITAKTVNGFTINTTPALTGTVGWTVTRLS